MKSLFFRPSFHLVFKRRFSHLGGAVAADRSSRKINTMLLFSEHHDSGELDHRLHDAPAATADLISEVIGTAGRRFPSRIERLIDSGAWTDAALALLELELPHWQLRRLAYDEGEWHCALSRQRELPDWLDNRSVESHHADLALAILSAFVDAQRRSALPGRTSVPAARRAANPLYEPVCCDNFA
jgi:hypothetical protein